MKKPNVKTELIDPETALDFLTANTHNRPIRPTYVEILIQELKDGKWNPSLGKPISFSTKGVLIDGQHRLKAIYESGVPAWCIVARDVDPEIQIEIDLPFNTRKPYENFELQGMVNAKPKTEMAKAILKLKTGKNTAPNPEILEAISEFAAGLNWALGLPHKRAGFGAANVRGTLALCYEKAPAAVAALTERAMTGVGIQNDTDPALFLQRVASMEGMNQGSSGRRQQARRILRCCYAAVKHEKLTLLRESDAAFEFFVTKATQKTGPRKIK